MSALATRFVNLGPSSIRIDYGGPGTKDLVDLLFRDIPDGEGGAPEATFRLHSERGLFRLLRDDEAVYEGRSAGEAADILLAETSRCLAENNRDGLVLHAAAVGWKGRCLLLPGKTGAGKTTLTAWLVNRGFSYLTDELVYIARDSTRVHALTRPLHVKAGGMAALQRLGLGEQASKMVAGPGATLVPPGALAEATGPTTPPVAAIVFPHHRYGARLRVTPLSSGQTGLALMTCLVNARNLPANGLSQVADLAKLAPGCQVRYSEFGQIRGVGRASDGV